MPVLAADMLTSFVDSLFQAAQVPADEANRVARSLVDASLCGHDSHGLIRVMQYLDALRDGRLKAGAPFTVVKQTAGVVVADGNLGLGQVQAHRLLERMIPRAQALGLAAGTLKNCGHIGRLGEYAEAAAKEGMAFVASVNNHGFSGRIAPPGGTEARIGTNPLCVGAPTKSDPVVVDMGTSVVAEGKVRVAFNKGQSVPAGWLLDSSGKPTTNPADLYAKPGGTILPLGGDQAYKGFGIGLILDMLVGGLSGAQCSTPGAPNLSLNAVFFLVMDVAQFAGDEHFLKEVTGLADNVRSCPRGEGVAEIILPGDPERRSRARRLKDGIPLDDPTWNQLVAIAQKFNVKVPWN